MAPPTTQAVLLSPAELAYLHSSLSQTPPIRLDSRTATQFRPLVAERDVLVGTNGSARMVFADGSEAVVGVKAEVERTEGASRTTVDERGEGFGRAEWVELTVEIPGLRDDDSMTVVLASLLLEAVRADGAFLRRLRINARWNWRIYIDILLLSTPLSYPLPLLSLTTHLALLSTRLPRLKSEADEDPLFDDDWEAAVYLYPQQQLPSVSSKRSVKSTIPAPKQSRPPITLLVIAVGDSILFDPSAAELAVAEVVLAVSVAEAPSASPALPKPAVKRGPKPTPKPSSKPTGEAMDVDSSSDSDSDSDSSDSDDDAEDEEDDDSPQNQYQQQGKGPEKEGQPVVPRILRLLAVRTIDPPSRLTPPGVPNFLNTATGGSSATATAQASSQQPGGAKEENTEGVWRAPVGGAKRKTVAAMVSKVLEKGGVAEEVLEALEGVE